MNFLKIFPALFRSLQINRPERPLAFLQHAFRRLDNVLAIQDEDTIAVGLRLLTTANLSLDYP